MNHAIPHRRPRAVLCGLIAAVALAYAACLAPPTVRTLYADPATPNATVFLAPGNGAVPRPVKDVLGEIVVNVKNYGALGNGAHDDTPGIQRAIDYAKTVGTVNGGKGVSVYFPPGLYVTVSPIYLPRTGATPTGVVQLVGANCQTTVIVGATGAAGFNNAGIIMWEATTAQAWHQRISNLKILCAAGTTNCRAIYHKANQATINATTCANEWLQLDLDNVICTGNNDDHQVFIDLEIGCRQSTWRNVFGDPTRGTNETYSTLLCRTRYQYTDGSDPAPGGDGIGFGVSSRWENVQPLLRGGGWCRAFQGRMYDMVWDTCFTNGMRSGHAGSDFDFVNCFSLTLLNLAAEGNGGNPIYKFTRCHHVNVINPVMPVGDPTDAAWLPSHAYALGARVAPTQLVSANNPTTKKFFTCTTAGTSGSGEPTWPSSGTRTDGTAVWTASTNDAVGNAVEFHDCHKVRVLGRFAVDGNPLASARLTKAASIDASCEDVVVEDFALSTVYPTFTSEVEILAPDSARNSISGVQIQGSGSIHKPYRLGPGPVVDRVQTPTFASTITPNPHEGDVVLTLTGNVTFAAPSPTANAGRVLRFILTWGGAGGHAVTWNAAYKVSWSPNTTAGKVNTITFECDGTNWVQVAAATGL